MSHGVVSSTSVQYKHVKINVFLLSRVIFVHPSISVIIASQTFPSFS